MLSFNELFGNLQSIPYTYTELKSPTNTYLTYKDSYIFLDSRIDGTDRNECHAAHYLRWINNGFDDYVNEKTVSDYRMFSDFIRLARHEVSLDDILSTYGLPVHSFNSEESQDDFLRKSPYDGFHTQWFMRKLAHFLLMYETWLYALTSGSAGKKYSSYIGIAANYTNYISCRNGAIIQERHCNTCFDVVTAQLGDLFVLGNKAFDGKRIIRCQRCGEESIGHYNSNRTLCEKCSSAASKQREYRKRKKEAANAQEKHP